MARKGPHDGFAAIVGLASEAATRSGGSLVAPASSDTYVFDTMPRKQTSVVATLLRLGLLQKDEWDSALHQVLEISCELVGVERASYWSFRADPPSLVCELGYVASKRLLERGAVVLERDNPEYFTEIRRVQVLDIKDTRTDRRSRSLGTYLSMHGIQSMLNVPVFAGGELIGVLCHDCVRGRRSWSSRDCELALTISHILSSLLEVRARNRAEENERRATFLAQASTAVAESMDLRDAHAVVVRRAIPTLGALATLIVVEGAKVRCAATAHVRPASQRLLSTMCAEYCHDPASPGIALRALRERQSLLIPVADGDTLRKNDLPPRQIDFFETLCVRSMMSVPLFARDAVTGVLTFASDTRSYDRDDLRFAEAYAQQIGMVLENITLLARAREAIRARNDFLLLAGHELRTPLTALKLAIDLLRRKLIEPVLPPVQRAIDKIGQQATRLTRLIDLVVLAPLHDGRTPPLRIEQLDLCELVRNVIRDSADLPTRHGCELRYSSERPILVQGDRTGLEVVVSNLLSNALKFGAGRPVEVSVVGDERRATLIVRDRGIGIPADRIPHIFERYERAASSANFGGLGLGLHIAAQIVAAHGGQIHVDSRIGEGSTFTVELPTTTPASLPPV
ncbi:ATP-binding protein [Nannocystis pusilla]|uniref:ATP-binding protein n=1 Tax=Nannocystis pusilla TaxID=889268 RepID=UPI003DA5EC20